jgi:hypothetical protein
MELSFVRAVKYRVKVFRSILEWAHGMERTIEEIFIPEKEIIFNVADGELHVFRGERERATEGRQEIEIDEELSELLETYLEIKEECRARAKHLLKE